MNHKLSLPSILFGIWFCLFSAFSFLVYTSGTQSREESVEMSRMALQGKLLWQEYNCTACHQIYGLGGYMGPDLTNIISTKGKGELYTKVIIQYGAGAMPNFKFSEDEANALVAYLKYVDSTGQFPPEAIKNTWYGSFDLQ